MGQKVNPIGLRLGINRTWESRWYANGREYGPLLHEDLRIRKLVHDHLKGDVRGGRRGASRDAGISRIVIERPHRKCRVVIHTARPGHHHRTRRREHRAASPEARQGNPGRDPSRSCRGAATGSRCATGRRQRGPAAGRASIVPSRHASRGPERHAHGRGRNPGNGGWSPGRGRDRAGRVASRRPGSASYPASRHRLCSWCGSHGLWRLRGQGMDFQGRGHGTRSERA